MAKSKTITLTLKAPTKGTLVKVILAIVLAVLGFGSGIIYQRHVDENNQGTPILCDCPDIRIQGDINNYPCCQ